jgi:peptide deformylase
MSRLEILTAPDPRLKQKSVAVARIDDGLLRLMDDMLETMYDAPGIGLAAPQVGVLQRIIVVDTAKDEADRAPLRMANPEIVWVSDDDNSYEEGCLSVPEHYAAVTRPRAVRVRYLGPDNQPAELEADGLLATVLQHEMDHLDGILFIDHLSSLRRNMILRKLLKSKKDGR